MNRLVQKIMLAENIALFELEAPLIATRWKAGQFIIVRPRSDSERIPLTIVDSDAERGTITLVVQIVGKTTSLASSLGIGDCFADLVGPLGQPATITENAGLVLCVAGGVGVAELLPVAQAFQQAGNFVTAICGARTRNLIILDEELCKVADRVLWATDDGSFGFHGNVVELMRSWKKSYDEAHRIGHVDFPLAVVHIIGPLIMMKFAAELTREWGIQSYASLNPIMIDGTGMCGGCRVTVNGKVRFTCVDGPEFDAHAVDFDELMRRVSAYKEKELMALERHRCKLARSAPASA